MRSKSITSEANLGRPILEYQNYDKPCIMLQKLFPTFSSLGKVESTSPVRKIQILAATETSFGIKMSPRNNNWFEWSWTYNIVNRYSYNFLFIRIVVLR